LLTWVNPNLVTNATNEVKHMGTVVPQLHTAAPAVKIFSAHALAPRLPLQELHLYQLQRSMFRSMAPAEAPQDKHAKAATSAIAAPSMVTAEAPHSTAQAPASLLSGPALLW
jgi:hypothetical protein